MPDSSHATALRAALPAPGGTVLILPSVAVIGPLRGLAVRPGGTGDWALQQALAASQLHADRASTLRALFVALQGGALVASDAAVAAWVRRGLAQGGGLAAFYAPDAGLVGYPEPPQPEAAAAVADAGTIAQSSAEQRIAIMLRRMPHYVPAAIAGELQAMLTPTALGILAASLAALAVAQAYGVGELIDAVLVGLAWASAGWTGIVGLKDFVAAVIAAARAGSDADIDAAARQAVDGLLKLGVAFLSALLLRARKSAGGGSEQNTVDARVARRPARGGAGAPRALRQTGGSGGAGIDRADAAYDAIRASDTDVAKMAQNTGFKPANIQKVKDHLFNDPHLLDRYENLGIPSEMRPFDSDMRIADAWSRLENGSYTAEDVQLLKHETAEAWYMRQNGPSYTAAHDAAQTRFPSPFD